MTRLTEPARLREFWDARYSEFSLSESGWMGAPHGLNDRIYACKRHALRRAIDAAGFARDGGWSVLDAGCGQGHFARFYCDEYPHSRYVGVDISARAVDYLQRTIPEAEFFAADLCAWRDPGGRTFDIVQSVEVLHLILDDDAVRRALANFGSLLSRGGALFVTAAMPDHTVEISGYLRFRSREFWHGAIAAAGLRVASDRPMYYWLPSGGPRNKYARYALTRLGPATLYALDRIAFGLALPRPTSITIDSRMRLLTLQRA